MRVHGSRLFCVTGSLLSLAAALSACAAKNTLPPEPPQSVRRGDDAFRYKQYATAIDAYRTYIDQTEQGAYTARVLYKTALAQFRLRQYRATLATLDDLAQRYPKGHWVQVDALRGDTERAQGNTLVALQDWEKAWKLANDQDRQKLRPRIVAATQDLSDVDLARARRLATDEGFAALLDRQIAARQPPDLAEPVPNADDESTLNDTGRSARNAPPLIEEEPVVNVQPKTVTRSRNAPAPAPVVAEPLAPSDDVAWAAPTPAAHAVATGAPPAPTAAPARGLIDTKVDRGAAQIGCLLPLSGSGRDQGERAMRGVRLVFGADNKRLVVADTQSDPAVAVHQFDQLAHDPRVIAVIGPLRNEDAETVARRAQDLQVPVLLLSRRDGLHGPFALQVGVTRAEQINGLLDYTMRKMRLWRVGLLYPRDATDVASVFRDEVVRRGGTVVGAAAYSPGTQGLMSEVAMIRKWHDRDNLQALFLPDSVAVAGQFAGFLDREMPDVTLLGVQGWEALTDHWNRLNGLVFADGFYAASERPTTRAFVDRFRQTYGSTPGLIEADAYDAATLVQQALDKGVNAPSEMLQALRGLGPVKGAAGDLTVTEQGLLLRSLFLLQVSAGHVAELGELSPTMVQEAAGAERAPTPHTVVSRPAPDLQRRLPDTDTLPDETLEAPPSALPPRIETHTVPLPPVAAQAATSAPTNGKVACLLPLTGPDQTYGKRALAGLRLAFDDAPEQLIVRDTGGDPATAADWLTRLQDNVEVVAVVGPLRSTEAEVAAPMAEQQHLPLLLLSQREGLGGPYVLQVAMTRTQQIRLLVHYAVTGMKLRRFGIVYPNDGYGSAFAETFRKEAASQGASVVGAHPYPPGATSFASAVVDVRSWQRSGLDAVFIPDAAPTATALAADVRSEVPGVVLLGTESWNDAKSLADAGSAIDGAIFADAFFADSHRPSTREFVERFQQRFGQTPTVFEAQAFDAGMALRQVIAHGAPSRERIIAELAALGTFQGAGELRAVPSGVERSVSLLRFHDGKVEEVSPGTGDS